MSPSRRFYLFFCLCFLLHGVKIQGQDLIGTTGLMNIPTADMQTAGTFDGGARWMTQSVLHDKVNFPTGIYYVRFSLFDFFEFTFRETLMKTQHHVKKTWNYYQQDRSTTLRFRLLAERRDRPWPSFVFGVNDLYSAYGGSFYAGYYGVGTKHLSTAVGDLGLTVGYFTPFKMGNMYRGWFGGVDYTPFSGVPLRFMADYDTHGVNLGMHYVLFDHLRCFAFTHKFDGWAVGMSYRTTIKF